MTTDAQNTLARREIGRAWHALTSEQRRAASAAIIKPWGSRFAREVPVFTTQYSNIYVFETEAEAHEGILDKACDFKSRHWMDLRCEVEMLAILCGRLARM